MKIVSLAVVFVAAFSAMFLAAPASAQGVIIPIVCDRRPCPPPRPPRPVPLPVALPVKSIKIDTKINGQVATTHVEQIFRNDTTFTLEGTYFFPIPDNASVVEFAIWEDGKRLAGEVRSREEARRIYNEIVRRNIDPGLLEYAGKDLLQATIFPIPPNSDKKLELTFTQVLKAESGTVSYRYPLGTGRNLWRTGGGDQVRPGTMPQQQFGTVSGRVQIEGREPLRNIYSPTHSVDVSQKDVRSAVISFETRDNDNDFQLFYGLTGAEFGMSLLTYREPGKDGYFLLLVSPRDDISERELVNKDIVFVIDTSGSMSSEGKMDKAKAALLFGIRTLRDGDRFNVISFAGEERLMETGLVKADSGAKKKGEEFVNRLRATGGTNINDTLLVSMKQFDNSDRPKILVFMTDGQPTVGEIRVDRILANAQAAKKANVRIFPFGFGYDVNTTLLDKLGSDNGGISDYVQPKEDLEVRVSNFFSRVSSPVLSDVELDMGNLRSEMMYPRQVGDIFRGMQVALIGRYKNERDLKDVTLRIRGKSGTEERSFAFGGLDFPLRTTQNDFLPRLWATRRVGWLMEQIRLNGETKELKDEVVELGTRYGIVTPYTSYLAADGAVVSGRRDAQGLLMVQPGAVQRMEQRAGEDAVRMSVQQNTLQQNVTVTAGADIVAERRVIVQRSSNNQFVGNRNFFYENNAWVDSGYKPDQRLPEVNIKFGSEEYFKLLERERDLAQYFALGEEVIVIWNDRVYRVTK